MDEQTDLPVELKRELADRPGYLGGNDLLTPDFFTSQSLQNSQLILFQAFKISCYIAYGATSFFAESTGNGRTSAAAPFLLQTLSRVYFCQNAVSPAS